jgi:membrane protein
MPFFQPRATACRASNWISLGRLLRDTVRSLRGHDVALYAAGVTFYAGIALVPTVLVAVWLTGRLVGPDRVAELGRSLGDALPDALGAPAVAESTVSAGLRLPPLVALAVLVPATFYGEGLRRAFVSLTEAKDTLIGWRGRLLVLPLFAAAPVLLLAVLLVTPTLARLFGAGGASVLLAIVLSFLTDWIVLWVTLTWVYRVVSPKRPGWRASVWGGAVTGSFVAGFVQGFVLFLAIPLDVGLPFGGFGTVGGTVAVGLWLYLLHVLVLIGYALTHRIEERGGVPWRPVVDNISLAANTVSHDDGVASPTGRRTGVRADR